MTPTRAYHRSPRAQRSPWFESRSHSHGFGEVAWALPGLSTTTHEVTPPSGIPTDRAERLAAASPTAALGRDGDVDVAVVGAGPAGAAAAATLAGGGLRVALIDKARFPRDKACGDLVGPRALVELARLGLWRIGGREVGEMDVIGPTDGRVRLPAAAGLAYPGRGVALPRRAFDAQLHALAVGRGAEAVTDRVAGLSAGHHGLIDLALERGETLSAHVVVGADGATSAVATTTGLLDTRRARWGFALRTYVAEGDHRPDRPTVVMTSEDGRLLPGYGWVFPLPDGQVNVGVGLAVGGDRRRARATADLLPATLRRLAHLGLVDPRAEGHDRLGGWIRMGLLGCRPALGRVLLVGDAAGLVNPLQGEGIAEALASGREAARAILADPFRPAPAYRRWLARRVASFQLGASILQDAMVSHPALAARLVEVITGPGLGPRLGPAWGLYWNDLLAGANPAATGKGPARALQMALALGSVASPDRRTLRYQLARGVSAHLGRRSDDGEERRTPRSTSGTEPAGR